ncbi:hypothetical protein OPT61_g9854 [Boeremia exigua]|uniref:Uncharacterized protein n=1 Tax=Boeremia exigua TaxID=749465 RepID=A0ACC2HSA3_9PLEO|nr:hypothetical protein OPT61_g9854 [Boeremia exigua]
MDFGYCNTEAPGITWTLLVLHPPTAPQLYTYSSQAAQKWTLAPELEMMCRAGPEELHGLRQSGRLAFVRLADRHIAVVNLQRSAGKYRHHHGPDQAMPTFRANDRVQLHYTTHGSSSSPPLVLLHGFTGSGQVFQRNTAALAEKHYVVVPDLRGHGESEKPRGGYHVARLALDLRNLIEHLQLVEGQVSAIGTSLGAAIIWYSSLIETARSMHD